MDRVLAVLAESRPLVELRLSADLDRLEQTVDLLPPDTDFATLRSGIVEAVVWCFFVNMQSPLPRYADNRKALLKVSRLSETAATALDALHASLTELFPWSRDALIKHWGLVSGNDEPAALLPMAGRVVRALGPIATERADLLRVADRGGRNRMTAFDTLISGLAQSYEDATGQRATVTVINDPPGHGGRFFGLFDALFPAVAALATEWTGRPLQSPPSDYARGQQIRRVLSSRPRQGP
jgi:hypothetical protein